jgi:hypothetical protein
MPAKLDERRIAVSRRFFMLPVPVFAFDFKGAGLKIVANFHTFHL